MAAYHLRFDDEALQERFLTDLARNGVPHQHAQDGSVECSEAAWGAVNAVAHKIRDSCFRWYFSWFQSASEADKFLVELRKSNLPFRLEHHKDRLVFLLARDHESGYIELVADS